MGSKRFHRTSSAMLSRLALVATVLGLTAATLSAPVAQREPGLKLSPSQGPVETLIGAVGSNLPVGFRAQLRLDDQDGAILAEGTVGADRTVRTRFVLPKTTRSGAHLVYLCVRRTASVAPTCPVRASFEVTRTTPTTSPGEPEPAPPVTTPPDREPEQLPPDPNQPPVDPSDSSRTTPTVAPGEPLPPDVAPVFPTPASSIPGDVAVSTTAPTTVVVGPADLSGSTPTSGLGMGSFLGDGSLPDLRIVGMEVTQGIQNMDNDMPLVAGRTTVLRLYVQTDGSALPHVSAAVRVARDAPDGSNQATVIEPDNGPITASGDAPDRADPEATLNFTLPATATAPTEPGDRLLLTAFVYSTHPSSPANQEPTDANNYASETFDLHPVPPFTVRLAPLHVHERPHPFAPDATVGTDPSDDARVMATLIGMYRYLPVSDIVAVTAPTVFPPAHNQWITGSTPPIQTEWNLEAPDVEDSINAAVQALWAETSPSSTLEQVHGIFRVEIPSGWGGFSNGTVSYGYVKTDSNSDSPWYHSGAWLTAHELSHTFGLGHVGCKGSENNPSPDYPYMDPCRMAPVDPDGWYGWDVRHQALPDSGGPMAISPDPADATLTGYPYMGYKGPKWADPWSYCRALDLFGVDCTALPIPENETTASTSGGGGLGSDTAPPSTDRSVRWVQIGVWTEEVHAQADAGDTSDAPPGAGAPARIHSSVIVPRPLPHVMQAYARMTSTGIPTGISARTVDADGRSGHEVEMDVAVGEGPGNDEHDGLDDDTGSGTSTRTLATNVLPWPEGAVALQILQDGEVVDEVRPSANPPVVDVLTPGTGALTAPVEIAWQSSDADGDALTFDIAYSPDGGHTWTALANDLTASPFELSDFTAIGGGDEAIFRVRASDGMNTGEAVSEPALVADQPPTLAIVDPTNGTVVNLHGTMSLNAMAWDFETSPEDLEITWTSSLDGDLGSGRQLVTQSLSAGDHVIKTTVTDGSGETAADNVAITVTDTPIPRLDEEGRAALASAFDQGPTNPRSTADGGHTSSYRWLAGCLVVVGLAGAALALGRSRSREASL